MNKVDHSDAKVNMDGDLYCWLDPDDFFFFLVTNPNDHHAMDEQYDYLKCG